MATDFDRIKQTVESEKRKKVQGEARIESLNEEEKRILEKLSEQLGKPIGSVEEVIQERDILQNKISSDIDEMKKILDEEGVSY